MREKKNPLRAGEPRDGALKTRIQALAIAALTLTSVGAAWAAEPATATAAAGVADCQMQPLNIPVKIIDSRPVATLTLNGVEVRMLVDSGAFYSFLTPSTADELKLPRRMLPFGHHISGYTGGVEAQLTTVTKVGLSGVGLNRVDFVVGGSELGSGIRGILGRNILAVADTEYDLAHGVIRLVRPKGDCRQANLAYWAGEAPVIEAAMDSSASDRDTAVLVPARINGVKVSALMDTGAPTTTLTLGSARRAGIAADHMKPFGHAAGLGDERSDRWLADIDSFQLGGEKITDQRLIVDDVDSNSHGMLLGLDYFLSHRVYVSYLQRKVYATWNGGAPFVALPGAAPSRFDPRYATAPATIAEEDADALARRGAASMSTGKHEEALRDLNRAIALKPENTDYLLMRAVTHAALNHREDALADADQALRQKPDFSEARMFRSALRVEQDRGATLADVSELDRSLAPSAPFRAVLGAIYAHYDMTPDALRQWDLWIASHPDDLALAATLNNRCWLRMRKNLELPLALQDCKRSIDKDGKNSNSRDSMGWLQLRLGDTAQARQAFDAALALNPTAAASLYGRGVTWMRLGDGSAAQRDLDAARKIEPRIAARLRQDGLPLPEDLN